MPDAASERHQGGSILAPDTPTEVFLYALLAAPRNEIFLLRGLKRLSPSSFVTLVR